MNPLILVVALLALLFFYCELRERYRGLVEFASSRLSHEYSREDILKISSDWQATTSWLDE